MKRFFTPLAILLCFLASSCMREESLLVPSKWREARMKSLVINASHGQDTKTVVPDAGTTVLWDADETIKVFGVEGDAAFKSTNTEPAATTQFGGSLKYSNGDKIFGLYPWSEDAQRVNDTIITNVPYFQLGRADSFAKEMNLSVAESNTLDLHFYNVCGGVRFTLDRDDIYRIILESAAGEPLAGDVKIFFEDGLPKVKSVSDTCSRVILNTDGDLPFESGKWYYVEFIPGDVSQGFNMTFYTASEQKGTAILSKPVTIRRGIFLSKESIDSNVGVWETIVEESPEIHETSLEVEIPVEADASYISGLKLSNYYGEENFYSIATNARKRFYGPETSNSTTVYDMNYRFAGNGMMLQSLKDSNGDVVMSCITVPGFKTTMSPEETAIRMLMTTPLLITDNIAEYNATVSALKELDEFDTLVGQVRTLVNNAMKNGKAPDYSTIDLNPVKRALIEKCFRTPDAIQGLDLLDVNRDEANRRIALRIKNHYRRVIHIYGRRVWMTDNNLAELRSEDCNPKLSDILKAIVQARSNDITSVYKEYREFLPNEIDEGLRQAAADILSHVKFDYSKIDIIPMPTMLEPQSASYWKIVKGSVKWWDQDTSTPFEATTEDLEFRMKDADKLYLDIYGIGKIGDLVNSDKQEQYRLYAALMHGAYNDFYKPIMNLSTGIMDAEYNSDLDLRKGNKNAPLQAFITELLLNFSLEDMAAMDEYLSSGDLLGATGYAIQYMWNQLVMEHNPIYYNLLYNSFKKYIYKQGDKLALEAFKTSLKGAFSEISLIGNTISISEAGLDVLGSIMGAAFSDAKTTFILDMEPDPYVTLLSPTPEAVIKGDQIELSWDMHMGNRVGNVTYDVKFFQKNDANVSEKTFREIVSKNLTVNISDLPLGQSDEKVSFQIIAHQPNAPDMIYARTEVIPIHIAAFRKPIEGVDLGLPSGILWGSMNLGATLPEEPGDYYAWGETEASSDRSWENYKWGNALEGGLTKYNTDASKGTVDNKTQLELADDAANVRLQGNWRMPTSDDFDELKEYCNVSWTTENGVTGIKVTSKTNYKSIFLPAVGYNAEDQNYGGGKGYYWTSSLDTDSPGFAHHEELYGGGIRESSFNRYESLSIRPVYAETVHVTSVSLDKIDLELFEGQTATIVATVLPTDATNKTVTWSSSNEQVATVSATGLVKAVAAGTAVITVTTVDGGKTATCSVTVTEDFDPTVCLPNQIWYTTSDGLVLTPHNSSAFEANIVSNYYENGKGIITFDKNIQVVGRYAFSQCNSLTSITIPEGVISIGKEAFYGCGNLISVSIPTTVTSIDEWAFYECSSLSAISFPDGISSIGNEAFWGCSSLTSITIPGCVTTIGARLFMGCTGLETVTIMEGVTTVGNAMFAGCGSLTSVTLPEGLLSIGSYAFSECGSLATITIPETVSSIGHGAFELSGFTLFTIPEGVTSISDYTFRGCSNLSSITISGPLTDIGRRAFLNCNSLTSINIPESVTGIGEAAFEGCSSLGSITLPGNVSVGNRSFSDCSNLNTVTFLAGLTTIGSSAFTGCRALNTVTFFGSVMSIGKNAFYECGNLTTFTIMEDISDVGGEHRIEMYAFCNTGLTSFRIPEGITGIGDDVFYGCSSLTSITIPGSVTSMGSSVFSSCEGLESVIIKDGVTQIGSSAFYNCSSLSSITIPGSVTSIGTYAFRSCVRLAYVSIPESVVCIEACTFKDCSSLSSITIPGSVTSIEYEAFAESGLTSITIPGNVKNIGEGVFSSCSSLESVTISDGVTSIGEDAFYGSGLTSITIPGSVTSIGAGAFSGTNLTSITIPGSVTNIEQFILSYCGNLKSVTISDGVTSIDYGAFENCGSLTSVSIPSSVTSIGQAAFYRCYSLSSVTIPAKVTSIESYTFSYCNSLVSMSIHDGIRSIGEKAFYECSNLTRVNLYAGTPPIGASGMFDYTNECPIYVPGASVGAYKAAEYWSNYADRIKGL